MLTFNDPKLDEVNTGKQFFEAAPFSVSKYTKSASTS